MRIEAVCARSQRGAAVEAMLLAHPYEEPAYDVIELAALDETDRGSGPDRPAAEPDDPA